MNLGINLMLWSADHSAAQSELYQALADIGYKLLELPVFAPETVPVQQLHQVFTACGLQCTCSGALPAGSSLISADESAVAKAREYMERSVDVCAGLGAKVFCGPLYHPVGEFTGVPPTAAERQRFVERIRPIADYAQQAQVKLALEPLNRFETHFLNTLADAASLVQIIDHPAVGVLADTFHQHIEENDPVAALKETGQYVCHFHASENHRGCPGKGQVCWQAVSAALSEINYNGAVVIESFGCALPDLAAATRIWRPIAGDPMVLAREAFRFLKDVFAGVA